MNKRNEGQFDDDCYCEDGCTLMGEHAVCSAANAPECLGGAPHWWDTSVDTGQTECRLCHTSTDASAKESL